MAVSAGFLVSDFQSITPTDFSLIGAPLLLGSALDAALQKSCSELSVAENRLTSIAAHDALLLLKSCLSTPKILHLLRSTPCAGHQFLQAIDDLLRRCVCKITNSDLSGSHWFQASLPIKSGRLGIRLACHLAYLAAMQQPSCRSKFYQYGFFALMASTLMESRRFHGHQASIGMRCDSD